MIRLEHISHHFYSESGAVEALRDVSLTMRDHEFVALVGPSGCGKTTLLRMVAGLEHAEQGVIYDEDVPLRGTPDGVGVVFQKPALLPWRTVRDNITLPYAVAQAPIDEARVTQLMAQVELSAFADAQPHTLSGGMQQRVALARALVRAPRLWLLDEPFAALDMMLRQEMNDLLLALWAEQRPTVLFVTHDLAEAVYLADRVVVMSPRPGRVVGELAIELPRPRHPDMKYGSAIAPYVAQLWAWMRGAQPTP